eukprot:10456521-Alexandrium_andersonii.AAC.1
MRQARPDLEIHALAENVPDIGEPRRAAKKQMLAVTENEWVALKSSGLFQRERCFISAVPAGGRTRPLPRRR